MKRTLIAMLFTLSLVPTAALAASPAVEAAQAKVKAAQVELKSIRAKERLGKAHERVVKAQEAEKKVQETAALSPAAASSTRSGRTPARSRSRRPLCTRGSSTA